MKLAISNAKYLDPIVANLDRVTQEQGWEVFRVPEEQATTMLLNNRVELALFSPLGYASAVGTVDYRIIAGPCVAMEGCTSAVGISFNGGLEEIKSVGSSRPKSFHAIMGSLILREKFNAQSTPVVGTNEAGIPDAVVEAKEDTDMLPMLDLSEEWGDIAEAPLPMAIWACRTDAAVDNENLAEVVASIADPAVAEEEVREAESDETDAYPREGRMTYRWSDEIETGLIAVMNLLYFHQMIPEIPEVKILGRDEL